MSLGGDAGAISGDLRERVAAAVGAGASARAAGRRVCGGFSRRRTSRSKKSLHAAEQDRADVAETRREFIPRPPSLDPDRPILIDETWAATNMTRRRGRAARGRRLLAPAPLGDWKITTLGAGLRPGGITAPCVFDGAINGERFRAYVEQMLAAPAAAGRHRPARQFERPQNRRRRGRDDRAGRPPHLPAALQPRPQPDRAGLAKFKAAPRKAPQRTRDGL